MTDRLIGLLCAWPAESRRRWAVRMLLWSVVLGAINVGLYVAGVIGVDDLILVTLILSWLALTITAFDIVVGTDVRVEVDVDET